MAPLLYPLLGVVALQYQGVWSWISLPFNLMLVPVLDQLLKVRPVGVGRQRNLVGPAWLSEATLWIAPTLHLVVLGVALAKISKGVDPVTFFGLCSTVGISGGCLAITAGHEMVHRRSKAHRAYGVSLLASVLYMHFRIEHVYGHHRHVGTERDLATAKSGESFFRFFNRTLARGWTSAWELESTRLSRRGLTVLTIRNRMIWYALVQTILIFSIAGILGPYALAGFCLQAFVAVHLLEATNYVQHYGMVRSAGASIREQEVTWDSDFPLSNALLMNLPVHAHHHSDSSISFENLRIDGKSRMVPVSFYLMVFVALIPPLWRRMMDRGNDAERASRRKMLVSPR